MAGTAFRDGKRWRGHIQIDGVRCYVRGATKREVQTRLAELVSTPKRTPDAVSSSDTEPASTLTVAQFASTWMAQIEKQVRLGNLRPKTSTVYGDCLRIYIIPRIGQVTLSELTAAHIETMRDTMLASGLSHSQVSQAQRVLHTMCQAAVKLEITLVNPAKDVPKPGRVSKPDALTSKQENKLLARCCEFNVSPARVEASCTLGMRQGEILALQLSDIVWKGSIPVALNVQNNLTIQNWLHDPTCHDMVGHSAAKCPGRVRMPLVGEPKTSSGTRTVPIPSGLAQVFLDQVSAVRQYCVMLGVEPKWLFPGVDGATIRKDTDSTRWKKMVLESLGKDAPTGTHAGRRLAATKMAEAGIPLYVAMRILGWSSGELMKIYARVSDPVAAAEMERAYGLKRSPS